MVINRKVPNTHNCCGFVFHPGAQFVADAFYTKSLKGNPDFNSQIKSGLMEIMVPVGEAPADGKPVRPKHSLAETVVVQPEERAMQIVAATVDGVDLKEISKLDKRRRVVDAAENQIERRQGTMDNMAPQMPRTVQPNIEVGEFE